MQLFSLNPQVALRSKPPFHLQVINFIWYFKNNTFSTSTFSWSTFSVCQLHKDFWDLLVSFACIFFFLFFFGFLSFGCLSHTLNLGVTIWANFFCTHEWTRSLFPELCWSHFRRLTRPTETPCGDATCISWTVLCFCWNSRYQFPDTRLKDTASLAAASTHELCTLKHFYTLLGWLWRRAGDRAAHFSLFPSPQDPKKFLCFLSSSASQERVSHSRTVWHFTEAPKYHHRTKQGLSASHSLTALCF